MTTSDSMGWLDEALDLIKTNPLNGYEDRSKAKAAIAKAVEDIIGPDEPVHGLQDYVRNELRAIQRQRAGLKQKGEK